MLNYTEFTAPYTGYLWVSVKSGSTQASSQVNIYNSEKNVYIYEGKSSLDVNSRITSPLIPLIQNAKVKIYASALNSSNQHKQAVCF